MKFANEPILHQDYPDPDVIRVDDTFYMISTTMHFFPGAVILRSYNLMDWEIASYVYDKLDSTCGQILSDDRGIYGKGMWAASLRYNDGIFYVVFVCNDTHKTYLYKSVDINGPWSKSEIEGFYHDCSIYFENGRVYIIYGNRQVYITELESDLSKPKENGLHRLIVQDSDKASLGYEGSHFYKIGDRYYLFLIHSLCDRWLRTEAVFTSDSLMGEFTGGDVFVYENGYRGAGIAQGGIVDDIKGNYFAILFQDRGAAGRIPYVLPCSINNDKVMIFDEGELPFDGKPGYTYTPLVTSEFVNNNGELNYQWQWNHEPQLNLVNFNKLDNSMTLTTKNIVSKLEYSVNTLTQKVAEYRSSISITMNFSGMKDGDEAGLSAFMGCYSYIGVEKSDGNVYLIVKGKNIDKAGNDIWSCEAPLEEDDRVRLTGNSIKLKAVFDCNVEDYAEFYYMNIENNKESIDYIKIGKRHSLAFRLDHFCGCRFGLFYFSKQESGGNVVFSRPEYIVE